MSNLDELAENISSEIERIVGRIVDYLSLEEVFNKIGIKLIKDLNLYCETAKTIKTSNGFDIHYNSYNNLEPMSYKLRYELVYAFVQGVLELHDETIEVSVGKEIYYIGKKAQLIDNVTCNLLIPVDLLSKELRDRLDFENRIYDIKGLNHIFRVEEGLIKRQGRRYHFFK